MQTRLTHPDTPENQRADAILRRCVHCGFCNATCPTYQLLGDELDGPRGRIYQIKAMLEGETDLASTRLHLDRCLTCRACETTCPSGVTYSELVEIGRDHIEHKLPRSGFDALQRKLMLMLLPHRTRFAWAVRIGNWFRPITPPALRMPKPDPHPREAWPTQTHDRKVLLLEGCVQPSLSPQIDLKLAQLLDHIGVQLVRTSGTGCCGAVSHHLDAPEQAQQTARDNIDALLAQCTDQTVGILMSASACELELREYPKLLIDDPDYLDKAQRISDLMVNAMELLEPELGQRLTTRFPEQRIAVQEPCTYQHGLKRAGSIGPALQKLGYEVTPVQDSHLCCGSAGTYSVFQPDISEQLRENKLNHLMAGRPDAIATANIGCLHHLKAKSSVPVYHWLELIQSSTQ